MRKIVLAATILSLTAAAYAVWPMWTGWSIRQAIRNSDSAYLETAVAWESVKETLKPSLVELALGTQAEPPENAGFWDNIKSYAGAATADALVERLATPEGLPLLFQYGKFYREKIKGQIDETEKLPAIERMKRLWARLKRAGFTGVARFEFLLADKFTPARHYDGALELRGLAWKLTELRIKMLKAESGGPAASVRD